MNTTTKAKHTAGPWHVGNKGADSVFTEDGSRLCTVTTRHEDRLTPLIRWKILPMPG